MAGRHVVVKTPLGELRGQTKASVFSGDTYYAFLGIPFAKPPLGDLRFKAPVPFGGWEGVRDALEDGNDPRQDLITPITDILKFPPGDEDCLYLNVYMNKLPEEDSRKKPVMVSIHGGGFAGGNGSFKAMGPDYLLLGDVVIVSFNYRCGALGFLSLGTEEVPGNAGLKDQTLALKWVRDNIHSFGGDPGNVTIFGISAGGASVDYQLISPASRGLFHKAIVQSGFSSSFWAFEYDPLKVARLFAKQLGCTTENPNDMLKFLQSVSPDDITLATKELSKKEEFKRYVNLIFKPCVEVCGAEPFLPDTPHNLLSSGHICDVPVIIGLAPKEGVLANINQSISDEGFDQVNKNLELLVPDDLELQPGSEEAKEAAKAIQDFFFKGKPICWENADSYMEYFGDVLFNIGFDKSRRGLLQKSSCPIYSYLFTNHTKCVCSLLKGSYPKQYFDFIKADACHGADAQFFYAIHTFGPIELTSEHKDAIEKIIKVWTSFAATSNPNCKELDVNWKRDSLSDPCHMDIGTSWVLKQGTPFEERFEFWRKLRSKYHPLNKYQG